MTPQTFLIESDNPYLLKALVEDLVKKGYKATWGEPYTGCTYICSNSHIDSKHNTIPNWKLYMNRNPDSVFHKTFKLPQDYQQAFDFAVEQLQVVNDIIKVEEKTGHLIPTEVYWSNNDVYPKGFIWRYKEIKHATYINIYSICDIDTCGFKKDTGLNNMAWDNIRKATAEEIKWLEACEKANKYVPLEEVNKPKFEVGKWYKYNDWYIKYAKHRNGIWVSSEEISDEGNYLKISNVFGSYTDDNKVLLTDLSEIQQYLPDGHEDKTIKYTLEEGEYYKVVEDDFWMIGKAAGSNDGKCDGTTLRGDCFYSIGSDEVYEADSYWCYYDEEDGKVIRNFTKLSKDSDEVKWLEACHKAGKYLTKEEALKPKSTIKVGDVVVVTKQISGNTVSVGSVVKIVEIDNSSIPYKTEDYYKLHEWGLSYSWCNDVRLATQEEINKALLDKAKKRYPLGCSYIGLDHFSGAPTGNIYTPSEINPYVHTNETIALETGKGLVYTKGNWAEIVESKPEIKTAKFGKVTFTIEGNNDYATTKYGKVTKGSIEKAVDYLKNPPTLAGFKLTIHTGNDYEKISNVNMLFKIGFGCQSGTLQELENILKCFS